MRADYTQISGIGEGKPHKTNTEIGCTGPIHGSSREKSYAEFRRLHIYIPLQAGAKVGKTRKILGEVAYALVQ